MTPSMKTLDLAIGGLEEAQRVMYLDYVNDFLTAARWSEYYGLDVSVGIELIDRWREVHEEYCANLRERNMVEAYVLTNLL